MQSIEMSNLTFVSSCFIFFSQSLGNVVISFICIVLSSGYKHNKCNNNVQCVDKTGSLVNDLSLLKTIIDHY